jgi:hypothetical protein
VKRITAVALAALLAAACSDVTPTTPPRPLGADGVRTIVSGDVVVTNSNDDGPGSFRDAIDQASSTSTIASIAFLPEVTTIKLQSTVTYNGTQDLTIYGNQATLDASAVTGSAFVAESNGNDLAVIGLTFRNASQEGLRVNVQGSATGVVRVSLTEVEIADNAGHGLYVDDQDDPADVTDQGGSAAAVDVLIVDSRFLRNGFSVSDRDGIRVDEGGAGDLTFTTSDVRSEDNAADGIEIDERGAGSVVIDVYRTHVTRNGIFDPTDLDDGFDIDESDVGDIRGQVRSSSANHNYEEGLDFNENHAGDLRVDLTDVEASFNREEGIDYEEDDETTDDTDADDLPGDVAGDVGAGDLVTVMVRITTIGNAAGDGGLKIREKGPGNADVNLSEIVSSQNGMAGVHVRETEAGNLVVSIDKSITNGNTNGTGPGDGIELRESNAGNITSASVTNATTAGNFRFGLSASGGAINISNVKGGANGSGLTGGGASFVVVP